MRENEEKLGRPIFDYAAVRDPMISFCPEGGESVLRQCWERSRTTLTRVKESLAATPLDDRVCSVAVSGSLGRMEQVDASDLDLIVLLSDQVYESVGHDPGMIDRICREIRDHIWKRLDHLDIKKPKLDGIFGRPISLSQICQESDRGTIDEPMHHFGLRIQLLLDSQPLIGETGFELALMEILGYFSIDDLSFEYLLNELERYYRSMAVNCHWKLRGSPGTWRMRNLKLKFSRRLICSGLMMLLVRSRIETPRSEWVRMHLRMTPLERLCMFSDASVLSHATGRSYAAFLSSFSDSEWRACVLESGDRETDPWDHESYQSLLRESERFGNLIAQHFQLVDRSWWQDEIPCWFR